MEKRTRPKTTVVIVDDFATTRAGLRALIEADGGFDVVGEAGNGDTALELIVRLRPHLLVLDLGLPGMPGTDVVRHARKQQPAPRIIIQTMYVDEDIVVQCLKAGADGYVLKQDPASTLLAAMRAVVDGERFITPSFSPAALASAQFRLAAPKEALASLSVREHEVLRLTAQGLTSREAAERLGVSPRTVDSHRANLMAKLGLKSQRELVRYAFQRGILT